MDQIKRLLLRIELFNRDIISPDNQLTLDEQKEISSQLSKLKDILLRINNPCQGCPGDGSSNICAKISERKKCKVDHTYLKFVTYDNKLEEEYKKWYEQHFLGRRDVRTSGYYLKRSSQLELARHFAQWGAIYPNTRKEE